MPPSELHPYPMPQHSPLNMHRGDAHSPPPHMPIPSQFPSSGPVYDCMCPTCMHYKCAMLQHHYGVDYSPYIDMYSMYQHQPQPYAPSPQIRSRSEQASAEADFSEVVGSLATVACTSQGRSMLQTVMRSAPPSVISTIFLELISEMETVALDTHGCHVLRSLIELLCEPEVLQLIRAFNETLVLNMCTMSQYTRKILQTLFERHQNVMDLQLIVDILAKSVQYLAATQQGCISLMRVFECCNGEQKHQLMTPLLPMFCDLSTDPFGNYVVQCAIEHSSPGVALRYVRDYFAGHLLQLATNKFASNVVEKVISLMGSSDFVRNLLLDELIFNPAALQQMVHDGFGNFVVQSLIESSVNPAELKRIFDRLKPLVALSPYGQKIEAKMRSKSKALGTPLHALNTNAIPAHPKSNRFTKVIPSVAPIHA